MRGMVLLSLRLHVSEGVGHWLTLPLIFFSYARFASRFSVADPDLGA